MGEEATPTPDDKVIMSPEEIEGFARALVQARDSGIFSAEDFSKMHARFKARDNDGVIWSFGLESGDWHRQEGSQWMPDDPPTLLGIDAGLVQALQAISEEDIEESAPEPPVESPAGMTAQEVVQEPEPVAIDDEPSGPEPEPDLVVPSTDQPLAEPVEEPPGAEEVEPPEIALEEGQAAAEIAEEALTSLEVDPPVPDQVQETPVEGATVMKLAPEEELAWSITVIEGPGTGMSDTLGAQTSLGRAANATVMIEDKRISRRHALVQKIGAEYYISDQNSVNGTFVNGERVVDPVLLQIGDKIRIGDSILRIHEEGQPLEALEALEPMAPESEGESERKIPWIAIGAGAFILLCSASACCALVYYFIQTQ